MKRVRTSVATISTMMIEKHRTNSKACEPCNVKILNQSLHQTIQDGAELQKKENFKIATEATNDI